MSAVRTDHVLEFDVAAAGRMTAARPDVPAIQNDAALQLAGDVQRSLLPAATPATTSLSLHTVFLPAGHVSGDVYSYHETDREHVSLSIADVTGHGLAAAMMATYILRALGDARSDSMAPSPTDRLAALNRELVATACPHAPFAAVLAATYDATLHRMEWARGGIPYPIHVRPGRDATQVRTAGCILGAFDEIALQCRYLALQPGESIVFHTDGLDALLLYEAGARVYDCVSQTPWFAELAHRPVPESLAEIEARRLQTCDSDWPLDDITVLVVTRRL